ncbi:DUF4192 domain-containing protein [Nocardiopsis exhalans]|uniref:DUF4192 domain-containing protein n=1 Tax=Nocardiopsis exhalans TaxID=163604 RepID=A0ABY5D511_9ACTN|nr:DUF4192 domain-containing protein [Nocardiopsis exhalans]USY17960.1 DUF4192 domain-containing protein [Nocardiopsis exhalans]
MNSDNALRLTSSADVVTTMPYLLGGEPPEPGLVFLALQGGRVHTIGGRDLDPEGTDAALASAQAVVRWASAEGCDGLMIVGYGTGGVVTPHIDAITTAATTHRLTVLEALRVHQGRYWSYLCQSSGCCPPQGTEINAARSTGPAEAVVRGLAPHGGQPLSTTELIARNRRELEPDASMRPEVVAVATTAAELDTEHLTDGGKALVRAAIDAERTGTGPNGLDELVRLAVLLRNLRVRDFAWRDITPENAREHRELWCRVTRAAATADRAAPAVLTAVAAWVDHDLPLALAALEEALAADPGYPMAVLILRALEAGLPARKWTAHVRDRKLGNQE